ncbi:MAG: UDP-N-acetylmuramoyl-L-alanyl-D-glutamate--2,6-diaminopimelate ligase [Phycisphaerae bacterium]|jgi:UDP-N-acetylmuramoyl-L-alanyl-D-glutamate--2,6-diaminopimelate ligase|nr:UDP-N-acetylmuramoyl-L-alanyl-D-glutamate--2,6-diaminopimelate ligase [Phycisphaerae bacterium]
MQLDRLLTSAGLVPKSSSGQAEVTAVAYDSREVGPGTCFVAVRGSRCDGHDFIGQAVEAGCSAVVCEDGARVPDSVACAVVDDSKIALGRLAQAIAGNPAGELVNVGVTGTNGKTTVVHLVYNILESTGRRTALLGTVGYETGKRRLESNATTPDPVTLARATEEMVRAGRTHLVMEVSSHALDQNRTAGMDFRVGVFTNISGDHIDYHKTMGNYVGAKRRLFESLGPDGLAVINREDDYADEMAQAARKAGASVKFYGLDSTCDCAGRIISLDDSGAGFSVSTAGGEVEIHSPLIGRHNVMNSLAAIAAAEALGVDLGEIGSALASSPVVPGRLEPVSGSTDYRIFVDYAHTDDALKNVLTALNEIKRGRLIVVFGCGGDRDRTKRPRMGKVASKLADRVVVTSDNPRSEDPQAIVDEVMSGVDSEHQDRCEVCVDRREAISQAIGQAKAGDIVLIAGKGHETYQEIDDKRIDFSDVQAASEIIRNREEDQ